MAKRLFDLSPLPARASVIVTICYRNYLVRRKHLISKRLLYYQREKIISFYCIL